MCPLVSKVGERRWLRGPRVAARLVGGGRRRPGRRAASPGPTCTPAIQPPTHLVHRLLQAAQGAAARRRTAAAAAGGRGLLRRGGAGRAARRRLPLAQALEVRLQLGIQVCSQGWASASSRAGLSSDVPSAHHTRGAGHGLAGRASRSSSAPCSGVARGGGGRRHRCCRRCAAAGAAAAARCWGAVARVCRAARAAGCTALQAISVGEGWVRLRVGEVRCRAGPCADGSQATPAVTRTAAHAQCATARDPAGTSTAGPREWRPGVPFRPPRLTGSTLTTLSHCGLAWELLRLPRAHESGRQRPWGCGDVCSVAQHFWGRPVSCSAPWRRHRCGKGLPSAGTTCGPASQRSAAGRPTLWTLGTQCKRTLGRPAPACIPRPRTAAAACRRRSQLLPRLPLQRLLPPSGAGGWLPDVAEAEPAAAAAACSGA